MTRSELKKIVKECLLEILSEGLGDVQRPVAEVKQAVPVAPRGPQQLTKTLESAVKEVAGNDNILAEVLADTALKTLPKHLGASRQTEDITAARAAGIVPEVVEEGVNIDALLPPSAEHWADLAFSSVKKI